MSELWYGDEEFDLALDMADDVHEAERARWSEHELAYDGYSAWPMRKELTPRERDILTRILDGWWHRLIELDAENKGERLSYVTPQVNLTSEMLNDPSIAWMRMSPGECQLLLNLRQVITPRQD